jgi:hypothetical protein
MVGLYMSRPHSSPHIGINGQYKDLQKESAIQGNILEVDHLASIVDSRLSGYGVACSERKISTTRLRRT